MGILSGNSMAIAGVSTGRRFRIAYNGLSPWYHASNTQGGTGRISGNSDWRGVYLGYGHTPDYFPGETFTFTGDIGGNKGATGAAIVDRIRVRTPTEAGQKIEYAVDFSANGALTLGTAVATDATDPEVYSPVGLGVTLSGSAQADVRWHEFTILAKNKKYVSSDTGGLTLRKPGNIDAQISWGVYTDDPADLPTLQSNHVAKLFVTSTLYWEFTWAKITEIPELDVDHESLQNVSGIVRAAKNGFLGTSVGTIKTPAGVTKWPA